MLPATGGGTGGGGGSSQGNLGRRGLIDLWSSMSRAKLQTFFGNHSRNRESVNSYNNLEQIFIFVFNLSLKYIKKLRHFPMLSSVQDK